MSEHEYYYVDDQFVEEKLELEDGIWSIRNKTETDNYIISSMVYDGNHEMLWIGSSSSRIASYGVSKELQKYSSFYTCDSAVVSLQPLENNVISITETTLKMHTHGGLPVGTFQAPPIFFDQDGAALLFTCGTLLPSNTSYVNNTPIFSTDVIVGTTSLYAYSYDINVFGSPSLSFELDAPSKTMTTCDKYIVVGGNDGKIRLLDGRMRMNTTLHTLDAHSGTVNDACVLADNNTLVCCGMSSRRVNPYDASSHYTYSPDPIVRTYDLRTLSQMNLLPNTIMNASFVKSIPTLSSVLVATLDGMLQVHDLSGSLADAQIFYVPLESETMNNIANLSSVAVSSSGQYLSVGTDNGSIIQFAFQKEATVNLTVNEIAIPTASPLPSALPTLSIDAPVVATAYVLKPLQSKQQQPPMEPMLSSFMNTPEIVTQPLRITSTKKISDQLLSKVVYQGFIGTVPNPGFAPNSMIFGNNANSNNNTNNNNKTIKKYGSNNNNNIFNTTTNGQEAYVNCDPRIMKSSRPSSNSPSLHSHSHGYGYGYKGGNDSSQQMTSLYSGSNSSIGSALSGSVTSGGSNLSVMIPTRFYKRVQSYRGKQRIHSFDYNALNSTGVVCLENSTPNSYTNSFLQILYLLPEIRITALTSQTSPYHHINQTAAPTLWCELGFLFHMMVSVERSPKEIPRIVTTSNFQRTFRQIPEAVALDLLEETSLRDTSNGLLPPSPRQEIQALVQSFSRFLLYQLLKEEEQEAAAVASEVLASTRHHHSSNRSVSGKINNQINLSQFMPATIPASTSSSSLSSNDSSSRQSTSGGGGGGGGVMDRVFGYTVCTSNSYLPGSDTAKTRPKGQFGQTRVRAMALELVYPTLPRANRRKFEPISKNYAERPSFSATLWSSLRRESSMKGWCQETESYEPLIQSRVLDVRTISNILTLMCGDTIRLPAQESIAVAIGDIRSKSDTPPQTIWQSTNVLGGPWLPEEIELWQLPSQSNPDLVRLVVSSKLRGSEDAGMEATSKWLAFDGLIEAVLNGPASEIMGRVINPATGLPRVTQDDAICRLRLFAVISQINDSTNESDHPNNAANREWKGYSSHTVLHVLRRFPNGPLTGHPSEDRRWLLINDLVAREVPPVDALTFYDWKLPCILFFAKLDYSLSDSYIYDSMMSQLGPAWKCLTVPASVFQLPSLSAVPCVRINPNFLPSQGELVAFDAEFVTVEVQQVLLDSDGQRVYCEEGRQILARISLLDGSEGAGKEARLIADDYVLPTETVVDYVTRFSGLTGEDLSPTISRHAVISHRTAYLKLRYIVDRGCVIVGHGLQKDFDTANIFVPPHQIRDTVELWRLPDQRKISLRFLAAYLLKADIQEDVHDSIEDAKTALDLFRHYEEVAHCGQEYLLGKNTIPDH